MHKGVIPSDEPSMSWLFDYMFGKGIRYQRFECAPFELPKEILIEECQLKNERGFIEFLLRNDWIQRKVGIYMPESNGLFPDVKGEIYDGSGDRIRVEVEFWAENYIHHGHAFRGCDLIISFLRSPDTKVVKGVPVWSFYEGYRNDKIVDLCLYSDIMYDFDTHHEEEDRGIETVISRLGKIAETKEIQHMQTKSKYADKLRAIRVSKGMSQETFASKIGIKRSLLGAYEEGRANPKPDTVMKICKMENLSMEDFYTLPIVQLLGKTRARLA